MQVVQHTNRSYADVLSSGLPGPTKKTQISFGPVPRSQVETAPSIVEDLRGVERAKARYGVPTFAEVCPCACPRADCSAFDADSREARASEDELSAVFEQLAVSARILTAISLQNGLADGTISPDAVTAELLNIGAAELELLKAFDRSKVDRLVEKLKAIGSSLDADKKTLSIENVIVLMNEWRLRLEGIGDVKDTSLIDSYLKAVGGTKSFDQTLVDEIEAAANRADMELKEIPKLDQKSDKDIFKTLDTIQETMGILAGAPKTLATLTQDLRKKKLLADEKSISTAPQIKFVDFLDEFFLRRGEISKYGQDDYDKLVQLFLSVFSLVSDAKASGGEMRVLAAVSNSRKPVQDRNITSGFLGGFSDIANLPSDADDEKFKDLTGGFDTDVLKTGLKPLHSLMIKAADVERKWSGMSADSIRATEDVREISEKLITSAAPPDKATLLMLNQCNDKPNSPSTFYDGIKVLVMNSTVLPSQIDLLADLTGELSDSLHSKAAELVKVKEAIKFSSSDPITMINEAKTVLAKFKKQSTTEVLAFLGEVRPKLAALGKKMGDVSSLVQSLPDAKKIVAALFAHPDTKKFETFFTCMTKLPSQFASASSTVALTRKMRKFVNTPTLADNVKEVSSTIDKSRNAVGTLQKACAAMKESKSPEIEEIGKLGVSVKDTNNFGVSVMAVGNIRKFGNKKVQIEKFLVDGEKVGAAIQRVQDAKKRSQLKAAWGDFPKMKAELGKLAVDLEAKRGTMVVPKAVRFADLGPLLGGLVGMLDANLPLPDLRMVLEALVPTNSDLAPMLSLFDGTDPSDFRFARFNSHLGQVVGFLPIIDKVLVSFVSNSALGRLIVTTSGSGVDTIVYVISSVFGVAVLTIGGFAVWWFTRPHTDPANIELNRNKKPTAGRPRNGGSKNSKLPPKSPKPSKSKEPSKSQEPELSKESEESTEPPESKDQSKSTEPPESKEQPKSTEPVGSQEPPKKPKALKWEAPHQEIIKVYINKDGLYLHMINKEHVTPERIANSLRKDMWVDKEFQTPITGDHESINVFKKVQRDWSMTAAKQYYDDRAKMDNPGQHWQPSNVKLSMTRGECPNFNALTAPVIEDGFFYHCTQISYSLRSDVIIGQAPQRADDSIDDPKDKKPEDNLPDAPMRPDPKDKPQMAQAKKPAPNPKDEKPEEKISEKRTTAGSDHMTDYYDPDANEEPLVNEDEMKRAGAGNEPNFPKVDTEPSFWKVVHVKKCPHIVQCCADEETSDFYPKTVGDRRLATDTLSEVEYFITCTKVTLQKYVGVDQRELVVQDKHMRTPHKVVHWIIHGWKQGEIPPLKMIPSIISVIVETRLTEYPTFVISALGRGRAGVFVFIEFYFQMLLDCRQKCATSLVALDLLRNHRYWIIDNGIQFFFAIVVTYVYLDWEWRQWFRYHNKKMIAGDHIMSGYYLKNNKAVLENFNNRKWPKHIQNEKRMFRHNYREPTANASGEDKAPSTDKTQSSMAELP